MPPSHPRVIGRALMLASLLLLAFNTAAARAETPAPDKTRPPVVAEATVAAAPSEPEKAPDAAVPPSPFAPVAPVFREMPEAPPLAPLPSAEPAATEPIQTQTPTCNKTVTANVVAFDQVYTYNRFGAFNPAGMIYALRRDVVAVDSSKPVGPGNARLRPTKRPRPIVLRVNEGDCLQVTFTNMLGTSNIPSDSTATRTASIHVNGLDYVNGPGADDGANVGNNASSLAAPGQTRTYTWYAKGQGQYLAFSGGAMAGGEGDGGQLDLGLFGSVNVEPAGAKWYRSQVTAAQLKAATKKKTVEGVVVDDLNPNNTPKIDYEATDANGDPILNMLKGNEIIHTDVDAVIAHFNEDCTNAPRTGTCGQWFREFTVIFHDETKTVQAFPELDAEVMHGVRDGFAINYGSGGMGAMVIANRKKVGPAKDCGECKLEEFFLESAANGDPAMIVRKDPETGRAVEALYPDDPSGVHHSYLNDPVRFRNIHAGPKETHVFHLHAHQWLQSPRDPNSTYLDSQTVSPGAAFTYEINYGGSGNRNLGPGDSIFHCHLYPHFAQGMWELWRTHDVFEAGTPDRNLPDGEIAGGTPNPALVPIPDKALPPMPTAEFKGFPFYVPSQAGHRAPQPPYDMDWDGGLPRHRVLASEVVDGKDAVPQALLDDEVAARVASRNDDPALYFFARRLTSAQIELLPQDGTDEEKRAMDFHQGLFPGAVSVPLPFGEPGESARAYPSFTAAGVAKNFLVNGRAPKPGAPFSDPCPETAPERLYKAAYLQLDMTVNNAGWHDRQARIIVLQHDVEDTISGARPPEPFFFRANSRDCVTFKATNLIPNNLNLDDFQVFSPTDTIGQHIHLVKFDVTSSDGSGNGWNYEDGTFAAEEVRERIEANNAFQHATGGTQILEAATHPELGPGEGDEWVGAQTTVQRWWADPLLNAAGTDRTIRTVFTHDHFGPSSAQHHGFYAALVVEPQDSQWLSLDGQPLGYRDDGGPTSYAASIIHPDPDKSFREFNLSFADFGIVYTADNIPVNPPNAEDKDLPIAIGSPVLHDPSQYPRPESISAADPGTQLLNYRNEPMPLRIASESSPGHFTQKTGPAGDMANVFSSSVHGDPATPLLKVYEGDRVQVRLIQGAQEEQHVFNLHGFKWLFEPSSPNSGYNNAQQIGISEHFEFEVGAFPVTGANIDYLYSSAATDNLWDGQWGLIRAYREFQPDLATLPNNAEIPNPNVQNSEVCPVGAPERPYSVSARLARDLLPGGALVYNERSKIKDPNAILFVEQSDVAAYQSGAKKPEPLILRANAGDCIKVTLTNMLPEVLPEGPSWNQLPPIAPGFNFNQVKTSNRVSLHAQLVAINTFKDDGANVGYNEDSTVGPGETRTYTWYAGHRKLDTSGNPVAAPVEFGATNLRDMGDVIKHSSHGAVGSLIIEPAGSTWERAAGTNATADIKDAAGNVLFREFVAIYQDDLSVQQNGVPMKNFAGEDDAEDSGAKAFNYRTEPLWARLGINVDTPLHVSNNEDFSNVLSSVDPNPGCGGPCGDPETPVFTAKAGTPVRFRVLQPAGHPRQHGFTLFGHHWNFEPWTNDSTAQGHNPQTFEVGSYSGIGPTRHLNILTTAGGLFRKAGDYLYRSQESGQFTNGLWGLFRVTPQ
jgi:manganese oxidase